MTEFLTVQQIIELIIAVGAISGVLAWVKKRITAFRDLIDAVDDALYDDKVDNAEFVLVWQKWNQFIAGAAPKPETG